jgi:CSLREA domain-containing protein
MGGLAALLALGLSLNGAAAHPAPGTGPARPLLTFVVNTTDDKTDINPGDGICANSSNLCSLRAAIQEADASAGADQIQFNIPGAGVHTIQPIGSLPPITEQTTIDGYTQPGSSANTLAVGDNAVILIELDGTLGGGATGLVFAPDANTNTTPSFSSVSGLAINRFGTGIRVAATTNVSSTLVIPLSITISGNFIGTNTTGTATLPNTGNGIILFSAASTTIGGATAAGRNLISGNDGNGIAIDGAGADNNLIQNNYIGTDAGGTVDLGNSGDGVNIRNGGGNQVGSAGVGNIISGNTGAGVYIGQPPAARIRVPSALSNTVIGDNRIGTNATGTAALPNRIGVDLEFSGDGTLVGLLGNQGGPNLISGNNLDGVAIDSTVTNVWVVGNQIGTNAAGTAAVPNGWFGVEVDGSSNQIGSAGNGNLISGNNLGGVFLGFPPLLLNRPPMRPATPPLNPTGNGNNKVQGNRIGTDITGAGALGNGSEGVGADGQDNNQIGGTSAGQGNTIAFNAGSGISLTTFNQGGTLNHAIQQNAIHDNGGLGIDLGSNGVTANDACDEDTGPNELQNYPDLTSATSSGGSTTIIGTLDTMTNTTYTVEFFSNTACDTTGNGEGAVYLGATTVSGGATCGPVAFTATLAVSVPGGSFITADATDAAGNTSEFSTCVVSTAPLATDTATATATGTATVTSTATATLVGGTATPTATVPPCDVQFSDVPVYSPFYIYIKCLACRGIVSGYDDGTFRPNNNVTRGQVAKIVANSAGFSEKVVAQTFADVPPSQTFYVWIERMAERQLLTGYPCGSVNPATGAPEPCDVQNRPYYRPGNDVTRGQLAKLASNAAGFDDTPPAGAQSFEDVPPSETFYVYIERLSRRGIISGYDCSLGQYNACLGTYETCDAQGRPYYRSCVPITRGQTAKIDANTFFPISCAPGRPEVLPGR